MRLVSGVLLMVTIFSSCGQSDAGLKLPKEMVTVNYAVEGMVCSLGCAKTIQEEVAKIEGVSSCSVSFEEKKAEIEFDKSQLSEEEIITVIEGIADGQYKVSEWIEGDDVGNEEEEEVDTSEEDTDLDIEED